jgi:hypothetical protein
MSMGPSAKRGPILYRAGLAIGSFGVAVAMLSVVIGMETQVATARPGAEPAKITKINRTLKGDRLPLVPDASLTNPAAGPSEPKLPDGCVASFNAARNAFWVEVPGRCVAAMPARAGMIG